MMIILAAIVLIAAVEISTSMNVSLAYEAYQSHIQGIDMRPSKQHGAWRWLRSADRLSLKRAYEHAESLSHWRVRLRREKVSDEKWLLLALHLFNNEYFLEAEAYAYDFFYENNLDNNMSWEAYGHLMVLSQVAIQRGCIDNARNFGLQAMTILEALAPRYWNGKVALLKLQLLLVVPTVPVVSRLDTRANMVLDLQQFSSTLQYQLPLSEFLRTVSVTRYLLPYQGLNDLMVNTELNKALVTLIPEIEFHSCHQCSSSSSEYYRVIKVGFVSKHLDSHSVGMSLMPMLLGLASRAEVELFLFYISDYPVTKGVEGKEVEEQEKGRQEKRNQIR